MIKANKKQRSLRKRYDSLTERFRIAYDRMSFGHRQIAKARFCEIHAISAARFNQKLSGYNGISVMEAEWMEQYNPYVTTEQTAA